jgi:flagellar basal-body rod protein FlgB
MNTENHERSLCAGFNRLLMQSGHASCMSPLQPQIFDLAQKRLAWASERQSVLARNIANLSTPGFQAADLPNFQQVLGGTLSVQPVRTDPNHMEGTIDPGMQVRSKPETRPRSADKNGVRLEEQLMKVADTETLNSTVTAIFKSYMTMFNTALGKAS